MLETWATVQDSYGRSYYWNRKTDLTTWTLPADETSLDVHCAAQDIVEDLVRIQQCHHVEGCMMRARRHALATFFNVWIRTILGLEPRVVRAVANALDHFFDMRTQARTLQIDVTVLETQLADERALNALLVARLKEATIRAAETEFKRLSDNK